MTDSANHTEGEKVSVEELSTRVSILASSFDRWTDWSLWLTALTAILALAYFGTSWMANRRASELSGAEAELRAALDKEFARELKAKDDAIAFVQNETSRANVTAANASMQGARTALDLEKQRERAAKAEAEVLAMKERMAPRVLSPEQLGTITKGVTPYKGTRLNFRFSTEDKEVVDLVNQLGLTLQNAGWLVGASIGNDVSRVVANVVIDVRPDAPPGVTIAATALATSLRAAGLSVAGPVNIADSSTGMFSGQPVADAFIMLRIGKKK